MSVREGIVKSALSGPTDWIPSYIKIFVYLFKITMLDIHEVIYCSSLLVTKLPRLVVLKDD